MRGLFVSHAGERCGVYQYGKNLVSVLMKRDVIYWNYGECGSFRDFETVARSVNPDFVVFNYQASTLPWLQADELRTLHIPLFGIFHECDQVLADQVTTELFDFWLCPNPFLIPRNPAVLRVPRFIPASLEQQPASPRIVTVGSFGFATPTKGFERLCELVNDQFDQAVIRINLPRHDWPHIVTPKMAEDVIRGCRAAITKTGIDLRITHDFFDERQLIAFLASNTLNAFCYTDPNAKGLSSCVDFALAAKRPLAVNKSPMFQHLHHLNPSLCVEDRPLKDIITDGDACLASLRESWSMESAAAAWDAAILRGLTRLQASCEVPDGRGFNKVLDDRSREAYRGAIADLRRLAPETITRKIPRANVQQAFALDSARRVLSATSNPRILAVGSYEDTAVESLQRLGYRIDEVDPNVNGKSLLEYYIQSAGKLGTYDLVLCVSVLEHVEDDVQFVRMMAEFLKPGGTGILTVDFSEHWQPSAAKPVVDYRLYTSERLREVLMPALGDCALVDAPRWREGVEDFEYEGCRYGFAALVFSKLDPISVEQAAVAPVWSEMVADRAARKFRTGRNDKMTYIRQLFVRSA